MVITVLIISALFIVVGFILSRIEVSIERRKRRERLSQRVRGLRRY